MTRTRKITARKRGNSLGFWFFRVALRAGGLRAAYGLLYFVCIHYLLFDRSAVRGALAYVQRRFPEAGKAGRLLHVYRLFVSQGKQLIDRHAAMSGAVPFSFELRGAEQIQEGLARGKRGLILLTAHVGNWQIAMTTLRNMGRTVNLVMRPEDNPAVTKALSLCRNTEHLRVISPEEDLGGAIEIMSALRRGDIVSFMGDRPFEFKAVRVDFLGGSAMFPCGPFQIAATAGCPLQILLSAREGYRRYSVDFRRLLSPASSEDVSQDELVRQWAQAFADVLSEFVMEHPYQCFLFTDVWRPDA